MDRIDLRVHVPRLAFEDLRGEGRETTRIVRDRVRAARLRMSERLRGTGRRTNAELTVAEVRRFCALESAADALVGDAVRARRLSARGFHRVLRVALTVADLAGDAHITRDALSLALLLRGGS